MATTNPLSPLGQLELLGKVPDSGVVDRIATHQEIAVPHWVEMRAGCLIGRYSSSMPLSEAVEEIRRAEAADELTPADLVELAELRKLALEQPRFRPGQASLDEKVAAEISETDRENVVALPVAHTILTGFLGLHARSPKAIESFARRFGTLQTYTEGFVSQSRLTQTALWGEHYETLPKSIQWEDKQSGVDTFEPIAYWQAFSRFAFLTLRIAAQLHEVSPGGTSPILEEDWQFFLYFLSKPPTPTRKKLRTLMQRRLATTNHDGAKIPTLSMDSPDKLRRAFCEVLNQLQDVGDVKLEMSWEKSSPTLEFRVTGLVSVIASQLLMAASQRENFVLCKECLTAFRPWQQPLTGNVDLYCEICREAKAPQRNAMRRYRDTEKYQETLRRRNLKMSAAATGHGTVDET